MYYYEVYYYSDSTILISDKLYTEEEFEKMCKEAPLGGGEIFGYEFPQYYSESNIAEHLVQNYGFRRIEPSRFFECRVIEEENENEDTETHS